MPPLMVIAVLPLSEHHALSNPGLVWLCVAPLALYRIATQYLHCLYHRHRYGPEVAPLRSVIVSCVRSLGPAVGIGAYLLLATGLAEDGFSLQPRAELYVGLILAAWVGYWVFRLVRSKGGFDGAKWRVLAPCELYSRTVSLAGLAGVKVRDVRVLTGLSYKHANGFALGVERMALTEDLIRDFSKEEVDAVIVHEVGHLAHKHYWWLYWPLVCVAWLSWVTAAAGVERMAAGLGFVNYALWVPLFVVPKLAYQWHCRRRERSANRKLRYTENPRAAISALIRLTVYNKGPYSRPWWSVALSTHPPMSEELDEIARQSGTSHDEFREIRARVEREVTEPGGSRYDLVLHEDSGQDVTTRPGEGRYKTARGLAWSLAFVALVAAAAMYDTLQHAGVRAVWLGLGLIAPAAIACVLIVLVERWRASAYNRYGSVVAQKLAAKYADATTSSMLIVDTIVAGDWDAQRWQAAWIGVTDGRLVLLSESRRQDTALSDIRRVSRSAKQRSASSESMLAVWYEVDGVEQWLMLRVLGRPPKGQPRSIKQLERYIRDMVSAAGAEIPAPRKFTRRKLYACAKRVPVALLIIGAAVGLVEALSRLFAIGSSSWYWVVLFLVVSPVLSWVGAAGRDDEESKR